MNKLTYGILAAGLALLATSCLNNTPLETVIASADTETAGNAYKVFAPNGDIKVFMVQTPAKKWNLRATVPLQKRTDDIVETLTSSLALMDESGTQLEEGSTLAAQEIMSILPVLNDEEKPARNILYVSPQELDYKTAKSVILRTVTGRLYLEATIAAPKEKKPEYVPFPANPTVQNLVAYYGIWGILNQYKAAYRNGNKARCKQIKERMSQIEDAVRDHPSGGRRISNELEDWMDDRIDEIEDQIDDNKKKKR